MFAVAVPTSVKRPSMTSAVTRFLLHNSLFFFVAPRLAARGQALPLQQTHSAAQRKRRMQQASGQLRRKARSRQLNRIASGPPALPLLRPTSTHDLSRICITAPVLPGPAMPFSFLLLCTELGRALQADSFGAIMGSALGTSTTVSYIESAAGIQAGGRTGLTAVVVGLLFLAALFFAPLATSIPAFATGSALVG